MNEESKEGRGCLTRMPRRADGRQARNSRDHPDKNSRNGHNTRVPQGDRRHHRRAASFLFFSPGVAGGVLEAGGCSRRLRRRESRPGVGGPAAFATPKASRGRPGSAAARHRRRRRRRRRFENQISKKVFLLFYSNL